MENTGNLMRNKNIIILKVWSVCLYIHLAFYPMGAGGSFPRVKLPAREAVPPLPHSLHGVVFS
jgi:hypothetical protein